MVQSLANIDLLKITYWNPTKTVKEVLRQIKEILQRHSQIDVDSPRNELREDGPAYNVKGAYKYSTPLSGAYHPIEDFLIKLALASECKPRANMDILDVGELTKAPPIMPKSDSTSSRKKVKGGSTAAVDEPFLPAVEAEEAGASSSSKTDNALDAVDDVIWLGIKDEEEDEKEHSSEDNMEAVQQSAVAKALGIDKNIEEEEADVGGHVADGGGPGTLSRAAAIQLQMESLGDTQKVLQMMQGKSKQMLLKGMHDSAHRKKGTGWAKGTGYGTSNEWRLGNAGWDPEEYLRAQQEKDKQLLIILTGLLAHLEQCKDADLSENASVDLWEIIEGSSLIPFAECELGNTSLIEMERHVDRYELLLKILGEMCDNDQLLPLFCPLHNQRKSLMALLEHLQQTANHFLNLHAKSAAENNANTNTPTSKSNASKQKQGKKKAGYLSSVFCDIAPSDPVMNAKKDDYESDNDQKLARLIVALYARVQDRLAEQKLDWKAASLRFSEGSPSKPAEAPICSLEQKYMDTMRPLQLATATFKEHKFKSKGCGVSAKKIFKEIASLNDALPLSLSSTVFIRYDEAQVSLMRALIIGPENTPYANGCFIFDIHFPPNYPLNPPGVLLCTTGGGNVRFNPNLYNCGKVCLSLLGTWSGDQGESWNPATSTLLQVLVSIQSLILIEDPYFNEPGYESSRGSKSGDLQSNSYNKDVRKNCLKWAIVDQMQHPPPDFADVIRTHFLLKREQVTEQLNDWLVKDGKTIKDLVAQAKTQLNKLKH